jgi:hypothetical protein
MLQPKKPAKKAASTVIKPMTKKDRFKNLGGEIGNPPFPNGRKGMPYAKPTLGDGKTVAKKGAAIKKAQSGAAIKKGVKGMYENEKVKKDIIKKVTKPAQKSIKRSDIPKELLDNRVLPGQKIPTATAQTGRSVKSTSTQSKPKLNMLVPGMGLPKGFPKKVETASAKKGMKIAKCKTGCK